MGHTHTPQAELHRGHQMAPTLARRKNTEAKETHTHNSSKATQGHQTAPTLASRKNTEAKDTHTHAPSEATQGPSHGLNPGTQRNTETKDAHTHTRTHTHTPQAKLDRGTKWPQAWEAERTL